MTATRNKKPHRAAAARPSGKAKPAARKPPRPSWDARYAELKEFKRKHGHCGATRAAAGAALLYWMHRQRDLKRQGKLQEQRARRLDELGFQWDPVKPWSARYAALAEFKRKHGHCRVSRATADATLADWVQHQRYLKGLGTLQEQRFRCLDELGFQWSNSRQGWNSRYETLAAFFREHGHCRVDREVPDQATLAHWSTATRTARRRGALRAEQVRKLDALGFQWSPQASASADHWNERLCQLAAFKKRFGHCLVSTLSKDCATLGNWVRTQRLHKRRGSLSAECIQRLDELGFVWSPGHSGGRPSRRAKRGPP